MAKDERELVAILATQAISTEDVLKEKQEALLALAELFVQRSQPDRIMQMIEGQKHVFELFSKPRTAKIMRLFIDKLAKLQNSEELQMQMCQNLIRWCEEEKRTYLKHRIIIKLAYLYLHTHQASKAAQLIEPVFNQVKKLDDKHLLVQINLLESKISFELHRYAKAKASLTSARANANLVYCTPALIADIDLTSGIIYSQDKDYKIGYSFFYQAFEGFNSIKDPRALVVLKYMILCKIMKGTAEQVNQIMTGKHGIRYGCRELQAMHSLSKANHNKSIIQLKQVLDSFKAQIMDEPFLKTHIQSLYQNLLQQNLHLIIEPYNRVQLTHIAGIIQLDILSIQNKLSEMILDKKIDGTVDQANGSLIIYKNCKGDDLYPNGLKHISVLSSVVDKIIDKHKAKILPK